jgi:GGDEF domain-containing protein
MPAALPSRRIFALLSVAAFALVSVLFAVIDGRGLGLGHYYYIAVALAALAGGIWVGVGAGALAAGLFQLAVIVNPHLPSSTLMAFGTIVRASTFISMGALIGWFSNRHRQMVGELEILAERDTLTGLPNTRAFEAAIGRRLSDGHTFTLLVGALANAEDLGATPDELLRPIADRLLLSLDPTDEIARIGAREFAILARPSFQPLNRIVARLEQIAARQPHELSFGWASYPDDGQNALALYRAANERLYARTLVRDLERRQTETPRVTTG